MLLCLLLRRPPSCTLFPYTTLFRSRCAERLELSETQSALRVDHGAHRAASRSSPQSAHSQLSARRRTPRQDRKSTRLNSSHGYISYAVFCLKKKNNQDFARYEHY